MSTSVAVRFLSKSFLSLHSLANLAPSMTGGVPFAPKLQNCLNTSSNERAITYYHVYYPSKDVVSDTPPSESTCHVTRHLERPRPASACSSLKLPFRWRHGYKGACILHDYVYNTAKHNSYMHVNVKCCTCLAPGVNKLIACLVPRPSHNPVIAICWERG